MKLRVTVQQVLHQNGTAEVEVPHNSYTAILTHLGDITWHEPFLPKVGPPLQILETEEIMELGELSQEEKESIFHRRALIIARAADKPGQFTSAHSHRRYDRWYFWPMGEQPEGAKLNALLDTNIIIAARKYALWMATGKEARA